LEQEIKRKCFLCDKGKEKTINTATDDFIKTKRGYAHTDCYKIYMTTRARPRLTQEEVIVEIARLKNKYSDKVKEIEYKDKLCALIKDYYEVNLPSYFFTRLVEITNGTHKSLREEITYCELYEMYSNEKMMRKLDKIAFNKGIQKDKRLMWDLAIMVGEYENYKKAKLKQLTHRQDVQDSINELNKYKLNDVNNNFKPNEIEEEVDINSLIL